MNKKWESAGNHYHHAPVSSAVSPKNGINSHDESFLDSPDLLWYEKPVEEVITYIGNARNYYYHGEGMAMKDQDLAACLATGGFSIDSPSKPQLAQRAVQETTEIRPFICEEKSCKCRQISTSKVNDLYEPLPSTNYIRLLEILPGMDNVPECRLHLAQLPNINCAYEALSYTWSLPDWQLYHKSKTGPDTPIIKCDGRMMTVGANLFAALKRIRNLQTPKIIWADALCINQADAKERSDQVRIMGTIFKSAFSVLIWLGESPQSRDENGVPLHEKFAYKALSALCNIVNSWRERTEFQNEIPIATHSPHIVCPKPEDTGDLLSSNLINWQAVFQFYQSSWFKRLWVVQEAALARAAVVLWDNCKISWDHVGIAAAIIRTNFGRLPESARMHRRFSTSSLDQVPWRRVPTGVINAYFLYRLSRSQSYSQALKFPFHELLRLTRQFECKDDRDRIYSLLGLPTSDKISSTIMPDYSKSTQEVYFEIARKVLDSSSSLSFLSSVQPNRKTAVTDIGRIFDSRNRPIEKTPVYERHKSLYAPDEPEQDYPSWVPQLQFVFTSTLAPPFHHPAFAPSGDKQIACKYSDYQRLLKLKGVLFDTISSSKPVYWFSFQRGADQADRDMGCHAWIMPHGQTLDEILQKGTFTKTRLKTLALTLTGGKNWYGFPVEEISAHLADYAKCLLKEGCVWSIQEDFVWHDSGPKMEKDESRLNPKRQKTRNEQEKFTKLGSTSFQDSNTAPDVVTRKDLEILAQGGNADRFLDACATACRKRSFFKTSTGLPGVGPAYLEEGDAVCILYGSNVPFVIRPKGANEYLLVGECYVNGVMRGEIMQEIERPGTLLKESWIVLA